MKFVAALVLSLSILCSSTVMAKEEINWPANANYVLFIPDSFFVLMLKQEPPGILIKIPANG